MAGIAVARAADDARERTRTSLKPDTSVARRVFALTVMWRGATRPPPAHPPSDSNARGLARASSAVTAGWFHKSTGGSAGGEAAGTSVGWTAFGLSTGPNRPPTSRRMYASLDWLYRKPRKRTNRIVPGDT